MSDAKHDRVFFKTPADFRKWLAKNHTKRTEQWVGFYKKGSGTPSITWPESVDEALCVGWIDGLRKSVDAERYEIRFTPRKPTSIWSAVNVARMQALESEGRMMDAGAAAFAHRKESRTAIYAYERAEAPELTKEQQARLRKDRKAWKDWEGRPAGYQRLATNWVVSAKRADTRERRLATLIECCAEGRPIPPLAYGLKKTP